MSTCLAKLLCGLASLLLGSGGIIEGARKRNTISVAAGLLSALLGVALLCASLYDWLTRDGEENDEENDEEEVTDEVDADAVQEAVKEAVEETAVKEAVEEAVEEAVKEVVEADTPQEDAE